METRNKGKEIRKLDIRVKNKHKSLHFVVEEQKVPKQLV